MDKDKQNRANIIKELSPYMTLGLDFAITVLHFIRLLVR